MSSIEYAVSLIDRSEAQTMKHVLEFGVYTGNSIFNIRRNLDPSFKVFGFDTFEGLPEDWKNTPCTKGFFSTNGVIPTIHGVKFFKGLFSDTIPEYKKEVSDIALIHIDCDLYSSTKDVLYGLNDYIKPNTILAFDEWFYASTDGNRFNADHEQKCFYEWVNDKNRKFEFVEYTDTCPLSHERKIVRITQ
jgi:hypothetical protein